MTKLPKKCLLLFSLLIGCVHQEIESPSDLAAEWKSPVAEHCFLSEFEVEKFPWSVGDCLNYEEVFKNYQYFESHVKPADRSLLILTYKQGQVVDRKTYLIQKNLKLKLQ